jgi:uncharacterized protein
MIGISVYLSDIDREYIEAAANYGVKYIFTSLHIPEENIDDIDHQLPMLLALCNTLGITLIPDISPYTFEKLGLINDDFEGLRNMGFDLVRLDFGFEDVNKVKMISEKFNIVLNASLVNDAYLANLKNVDVDLDTVYLMHNFYPRQDSGLDDAYFVALNSVHQNYTIKTMAFVVGDMKRRLPLYEGLPTLERHRHTNPYVAALEFYIDHKIDMVFIGDNKAHIHNLKYMHTYLTEQVITIPVKLKKAYEFMYDTVYNVRQDRAPSIIRLAIPRVKDLEIIANNGRHRGAIVVDNQLAQRYSGEVQIIKADLPYSARSNNIGWVHPDYIDLLEYIDHSVRVKFVDLNEVEI